jgi:mannitol 2-dehydrogenase
MATSDPDAWLGIGDVYGETGRNPRFREAFAHALGSLGAKGTLSTLQAYADGEF